LNRACWIEHEIGLQPLFQKGYALLKQKLYCDRERLPRSEPPFCAKIALAMAPAHASRVFAKAEVIALWVRAGRMAQVDPLHLFFTLWAATQTYADFEVQVCAVLGRPALTPADQTQATEHVVSLLLRGCGL
jgi:AcrR family transcriptional regulator